MASLGDDASRKGALRARDLMKFVLDHRHPAQNLAAREHFLREGAQGGFESELLAIAMAPPWLPQAYPCRSSSSLTNHFHRED